MKNNSDTNGISQEVSDVLFSELRSWSSSNMDGDDAFRYEMFARRIQAAEYGRPDAVEWANNWYADILREQDAAKQAKLVATARLQAERDEGRARLAAGLAGNPLYQAYLDTLESSCTDSDEAVAMLNIGYFSFHGQRTAEYERTDKRVSFAQYVRDYADQHLSERAKARLNLH